MIFKVTSFDWEGTRNRIYALMVPGQLRAMEEGYTEDEAFAIAYRCACRAADFLRARTHEENKAADDAAGMEPHGNE